MSTVAEHLAMLEFYQATENKAGFDTEANLLVKAHLNELIKDIDPQEMKYARKHVKQAMLDLSPLSAPLVDIWESKLAQEASTS